MSESHFQSTLVFSQGAIFGNGRGFHARKRKKGKQKQQQGLRAFFASLPSSSSATFWNQWEDINVPRMQDARACR